MYIFMVAHNGSLFFLLLLLLLFIYYIEDFILGLFYFLYVGFYSLRQYHWGMDGSMQTC